MAKQGMDFQTGEWSTTDSILNRGGFEAISMTLDSTAFTNGVCKSGTPIDKDGKIANTSEAIGILYRDVKSTGFAPEYKGPHGALLKKAYINLSRAEASSGLTIASAVKTALPMIVWE